MALDDYNRKRKFEQTPEPSGEIKIGSGPLRFVVQMHHASRLHYDFRIEAGGVLKSWAVPKGPSVNAQDQRLAVQVEDHPIAYGSFEGIIPKGNYGAGTVMLWDEGIYLERNSKSREESEKAVLHGLEEGHVTLLLEGTKLQGEFALVRLKDADAKSWLLIKKRDSYASRADITRENRSVKSGRTLEEIASQSSDQGDIWLPARTTESESHGIRSQKKTPKPLPGVPSILLQALPKKEALPRRTKPMLATPFAEPFDQTGWIFELDRDGYRAIAEIEKGVVRLHSKQLLPFEKKFPEVVESLRLTPITAVLDGDIVTSENQKPVYWVKDLLHLNGVNTRILPLIERKKLLEQLEIFNGTVRFCSHVENEGVGLYERASSEDSVGIVARNSFSTYQSGSSKNWLKISLQESAKEQGPRFSNLDKIYWPEEKITKGNLIEYYKRIASVLLPHLRDRPESLHRHPDGIASLGFFQKDLVGHHPRWVHTERVFSESVGKSIDYLLCQNEWTLLYMANLGCIEINPWLSRIGSLDRPDSVVIDLDPDENPFDEVIEIALAFHQVLDSISAKHVCKTSGATGLHIYVPIQAKYDYETSRNFALSVCQVVHGMYPKLTSLERTPAKRKKKIYLDYLQNAQGQTVASPYSVRPRPGAPVSTPLLWEELKSGFQPESFNIHSIFERIKTVGDLWRPILVESVDLEVCLSSLASQFPKVR
jgi:bifunctional non-homologous end joining protein LigD